MEAKKVVTIVTLEAENIKRLKAVEITPEGNLVVVGGRNAQGKSSVLDSIAYALGGKKLIPDQPIRDGRKKAEVKVKLSNGLTVKRTFTEAGGGSLSIVDSDNKTCSSPQALLEKLTGSLTFDPLEFVKTGPLQQREILKSLVGLDFTEHDRKRQEHYDERTEVGRSLKIVKARITPKHTDVPDEEVSVVDVVAELQTIKNTEHRIERAGRERDNLVQIARGSEQDVEAAEQEIKAAQDRLQEAEKRHLTDVAAADKATADLEAMPKPDEARVNELNELILNGQEISRKIRENQARAENVALADEYEDQIAEHTEKIEGLDNKKAADLAAAKFPIEGLVFDETGVSYNGIPFQQASSAEQLRVSVAMGLALNPDLKVLLIRDGSLLDEDGIKLIAEMAKKADAQVWMERVGRGAECQVVIEDGEVA